MHAHQMQRFASSLNHSTLAVVMPYIDSQLPKIFASVARWAKHVPCTRPPLPVQLLFYHPTDASESNLTTARVLAEMGADMATCFGLGVGLLYAHLPAEVAWRHPDGTCGQFYQLFELLRGRVDYFYLMEPDALPIRDEWLSRLVEMVLPPCGLNR